MASPSVDEILTELNPFGRVQVAFLLLSAYIQFFLPLSGQSVNFLAATPDHHCTLTDEYSLNQSIPLVKEGSSLRYSQCSEYVYPTRSNETQDCQNGWEYDDEFYGETIISEWDLVCSQFPAAEVSQSILQVGGMVGALLFGMLADRYGRRASFMLGVTIYCVFGFVICLSPNFVFFVVLRFFCGISQMAVFIPFSSVVSEFMIPKYRNRAMTVPSIAWAFGLMFMALMAFLIDDWRYLQFTIVSPFIPVMVVMGFIPESLRWVLSKNKQRKAVTLVTRLAKLNKCKVPSSIVNRLQDKVESDTISSTVSRNVEQLSTSNCGDVLRETDTYTIDANKTTDQVLDRQQCDRSKPIEDTSNRQKIHKEQEVLPKRHNLWSMFRPPVLHVTLVISTIRFSYTLIYYGFALSTGRLAGNPYLNFFYSALAELPARMLTPILYKMTRRTYIICICLTACGIGLTTLIFLPDETKNGTSLDSVRTAIALLGKGFITVLLGGLMLLTVELFPTIMRNTGNGLVVSIGRIGGVLAPFMLYMDAYIPFFSSITMAVMAFITAVLVLTLPDTRTTTQPQNADDLRILMKSRKKKHSDAGLKNEGFEADIDL